MRDIRYAFRLLKKSPGFAIIAILTLAMGAGLTTALFTVINAVLLRPLAFEQPDRLMMLSETSAQLENMSVSYQNYLDWTAQNKSFESLTAFRLDDFNLTARGEAERVRGRMISANFLSTLGIQPALGRGFHKEEDRVGAAPVAMLSHNLWKNHFAADPNILGQTIQANDRAFTVVGVMPESYHLFTEVDFFVPIGLFADDWPSRDNHPGIYVIGRLRNDASLVSAQADLTRISQALAKQYPDTNSKSGVDIEALDQRITGDVRPALYMLFGAVVFVLLIGCANIANMLLARGMARQKEISIRMTLGATGRDLVRQFLVESLVISFAGGILGLLLAQYSTDLLLWLRPADLPRLEEIHIDWRVLAFTFGVSVVSGLFFGLLPLHQTSRIHLNESIKQAGGSTPPFQSRYRLRNALVISQVAFSLILLIGAGLMTRSILVVLRSSPGFNPDGMLSVQMSLSKNRYQGKQVMTFIQEAQRRLEQIGGVESVAYTNGLPIAGANEGIFWIEGRPRPRAGEELPAVQYYVSPNYHQTMKIPLLKGKLLSTVDGPKQQWKVLIDDTLAKKHFSKMDPIGQSIRLTDDLPAFEIVGITSNVKHYGLDVAAPIQEQTYFSIQQIPEEFLTQVSQDLHFLIRSSGDPSALLPQVRAALKELDPQQPFTTRAMTELISESLAARKFSMMLMSIFAGVALFLAVAGIYGVLSYTIAQRSKEIGIRVAVGAAKKDVFTLVLAGGMKLIAAGLAFGIVAALALSNFVASQLYGVTATDPLTFVLISALFAVVGLTATYVPAARATRVNPVTILKCE